MTSITQKISKIRNKMPDFISARSSDADIAESINAEASRDLEIKKTLRGMGCHDRPVYTRTIPHEKHSCKLSFYYGRKAMFYVHKHYRYGLWENSTICIGKYDIQ